MVAARGAICADRSNNTPVATSHGEHHGFVLQFLDNFLAARLDQVDVALLVEGPDGLLDPHAAGHALAEPHRVVPVVFHDLGEPLRQRVVQDGVDVANLHRHEKRPLQAGDGCVRPDRVSPTCVVVGVTEQVENGASVSLGLGLIWSSLRLLCLVLSLSLSLGMSALISEWRRVRFRSVDRGCRLGEVQRPVKAVIAANVTEEDVEAIWVEAGSG